MNNSVWIYPWDLQDEGIASVLDRLKDNNINGVNVAVNYHSGMFLLPHNPKRKLYFPRPGALYFPPDASWYEKSVIKPPVSEFASKTFWVKLREETAKRGMTVTAWSLALHNSFIGFNYPQTNVVNAFGDHYPTALCPSNSSIREFLLNLYNDLSKNYDFDNILIESLEYMPFRHGYHHEVIGIPVNATIDFFMSLSFSPELNQRAVSNGIDIEAVRNYVRNKVEEAFSNPSASKEMSWDEIEAAVDGHMKAYLNLREEVISSLLGEIKSLIAANNKNTKLSALDFGPLYAMGPRGKSWQNGVNLEKIVNFIDEIHPTFYFADITLFKSKVDEYLGIWRSLERPVDLVPAIRAILPQINGPADLHEQVSYLKPHSSGFTFYNYGFMVYETLKWISNETA